MSRLIDQLASLTVEELDAVIAKAKALKQFANSGDRAAQTGFVAQAGTDPYDYVLAIVCRVCRELGTSTVGVAQAKDVRSYKHFRTHIPAVAAHIQSFTHNRTQEQAVFKLAYHYMARERGSLRGLNMLLASTAQIPLMLEEMFPGYYKAGLMPVVTASLTTVR